jgi:hypothetical protein
MIGTFPTDRRLFFHLQSAAVKHGPSARESEFAVISEDSGRGREKERG